MPCLHSLQDGVGVNGSTAGAGIMRVPYSHVVFFGGMQPDVFNRILDNPTCRDNGLSGRFLALFPATGGKGPGKPHGRQLKTSVGSAAEWLSILFGSILNSSCLLMSVQHEKVHEVLVISFINVQDLVTQTWRQCQIGRHFLASKSDLVVRGSSMHALSSSSSCASSSSIVSLQSVPETLQSEHALPLLLRSSSRRAQQWLLCLPHQLPLLTPPPRSQKGQLGKSRTHRPPQPQLPA